MNQFVRNVTVLLIISSSVFSGCQPGQESLKAPSSNNYNDLVALFKEWRSFEQPPLREGAPDYTTETFISRRSSFEALQATLMAFDTTGWPVEH